MLGWGLGGVVTETVVVMCACVKQLVVYRWQQLIWLVLINRDYPHTPEDTCLRPVYSCLSQSCRISQQHGAFKTTAVSEIWSSIYTLSFQFMFPFLFPLLFHFKLKPVKYTQSEGIWILSDLTVDSRPVHFLQDPCHIWQCVVSPVPGSGLGCISLKGTSRDTSL